MFYCKGDNTLLVHDRKLGEDIYTCPRCNLQYMVSKVIVRPHENTDREQLNKLGGKKEWN